MRAIEQQAFHHARAPAVRLAQACLLLKDTSDSVKVIAATVGYTHANHFGSAFRKAYGVSPARYRANRQRMLAK
jgi:AraC-like DNA-binding protein